MDSLDRQLINHYQGEFPLVERPFQALAEKLEISEREVMTRLRAMLENGILTRFGPLYNIEKMGGCFSLCAMQVPASDFDTIAEAVNRFTEVAHNYERDHRLNMWFVIAAESAEELQRVIRKIEQLTGLGVYNFPRQQEFYVNFQPRA